MPHLQYKSATLGKFGRHACSPPCQLCSDTDNPAAESDLAVESRPGEVACVPATGVAGIDPVLIVANRDEPVALAEPTRAIQQQRTLVQPRFQLGDQVEWLLARGARLESSSANWLASRQTYEQRPVRWLACISQRVHDAIGHLGRAVAGDPEESLAVVGVGAHWRR